VYCDHFGEGFTQNSHFGKISEQNPENPLTKENEHVEFLFFSD